MTATTTPQPPKEATKPFEAHDVWTASFLHVNGLPFLGCYRNELGKTRWQFGDKERAYRLYLVWRSGDPTDTLVPGVALVDAYRDMCAVAKDGTITYRGDGHAQHTTRA